MITGTELTVDWVVRGSGESQKAFGSRFMQLVCRRTLPLGRISV